MDALDRVFEFLDAYQGLFTNRRQSGLFDPELPPRWKAAVRRLACRIPHFEDMPRLVWRACTLPK
jgi:hypothetical protein